MSFIISIHTYEGIVMAADSRLSLNTTVQIGSEQKPISIEFSNATNKLFCTKRGVGIATCGEAGIKNNPIAGYIEEFSHQHSEAGPNEVATAINAFLTGHQPSLNSCFHISGYDDAGNPALFRVLTPTGKVTRIDTSFQGTIWDGELDIVQRLINDVWLADDAGLPVDHLTRYEIPWNFFSLQDAVDFARFAMETTIGAIRFQNRLKTVGGPVDVLVVRRGGAVWVQRKSLTMHPNHKPFEAPVLV